MYNFRFCMQFYVVIWAWYNKKALAAGGAYSAPPDPLAGRAESPSHTLPLFINHEQPPLL